MRQIITLLFSLSLTLSLHGQGAAPEWIRDKDREYNYPSNEYFTSFVFDHIQGRESIRSAINRIKKEAQVSLSENIITQIKSKSQSYEKSVLKNGKERLSREFEQTAQISSYIEVAGAEIKTYYDSKDKLVYAFAYVNKHVLSEYYENAISLNISKVENTLKLAKNYDRNGSRNKAIAEYKNAISMVDDVYALQIGLNAINSDASKNNLQTNKINRMRDESYNAIEQLRTGFKPFRIDMGLLGITFPSSEEYSTGFMMYLEPKYEIIPQLSAGIRIDLAMFGISPDGIGLSTNYMLTSDYHLTNTLFRPFVGIGIGVGGIASMEFDNIAESCFVMMFRTGFDVSHFRLGIGYHIAFVDPTFDYLAFTIAFYIGGGKR